MATPCVLFKGILSPKGYGRTSFEGKRGHAHRFSLEEKLGRKLLKGMLACHSCDNRACINQEHLYEGTPKQNSGDMVARSRHQRREQRPNGVLTAGDVAAIKTLLGQVPQTVIASTFGVSPSTVCDIKKGRRHYDILATIPLVTSR